VQGIFKWGGVAASVILILFAIGSIGAGIWGIHYTRDQLKLEQITGTPDMTPSAIKTEAQQAGLTNVDLPTCSVAGDAVNTGKEAKCFASYMRIHTLLATGGQTYSQMGQYLDANGNQTSDTAKAAKDPKTGKPVPNQARDVWVTYTALSTALNTSYFAETVGVFGIVMGIALLLVGIGFLVLVLGGIERKSTTAATPTPAGAKT
jgi:uncharacterized iron-regulated membrane protein